MSLYDKLFEICCSIAAFILRPAVRWTIRFATGIGLVVGVFALARATLVTHTLGLGGATLIAIALIVIGCLGLRDD